MKKMGFNLGKRKKLIKYIKHFKTIKIEDYLEVLCDEVFELKKEVKTLKEQNQ